MTFVYAINDEKGRRRLWYDLVKLSKSIDISWMVVMDFSEILKMNERVGSGVHKQLTEHFRECIMELV